MGKIPNQTMIWNESCGDVWNENCDIMNFPAWQVQALSTDWMVDDNLMKTKTNGKL